MAGRAAVFLDRDGVLNEERSHVRRPEDLVLISGAVAAVRRLNESDFDVIVVTNQSIVARGGLSEEELDGVHLHLRQLLEEGGAHLDALYYCPHHPNPGVGGVAAFAMTCSCRKPAVGMVERAARERGVDLKRSWMIGDSSSDMEMARRSGLRAILVRTGHGGRDGRHDALPDFIVRDLAAAVDLLLTC